MKAEQSLGKKGEDWEKSNYQEGSAEVKAPSFGALAVEAV